MVLADALADPDRERCGLLLGAGAGPEGAGPEAGLTITRVLPAANVHPEAPRAYEVDPEVLFRIHRDAREGGPDLLGVYHSHPHAGGLPLPSDRDLEEAWPHLAYLIVAPGPAVGCWRLVGGRFVRVPVAVPR